MTSKHRGLLPAQAHVVADLVEYSPGSVVSRTLGQSPGGSLTAFAFDAGQSLSEHTSPYDAFVHCLDGTIVLTIGGIPVTLQPGEIGLMPADVPHAVSGPDRFKMLLIMIKG